MILINLDTILALGGKQVILTVSHGDGRETQIPKDRYTVTFGGEVKYEFSLRGGFWFFNDISVNDIRDVILEMHKLGILRGKYQATEVVRKVLGNAVDKIVKEVWKNENLAMEKE